jgi:hypothetical protein
MDAKNRYCIWSQIRDDARYLPRFIDWHLSQGFEYFVFGDDRSNDDPHSLLKPYIDQGIVVIYDATKHSENHGRFVGKFFFESTDIVAFIDADEFVRTKSGHAKNELDLIFANQEVEIVYLNWVFKHSGSLHSDDLGDYRDSFSYTKPDIFTKYVVRFCSILNLAENELGCHFASGISIEKSQNGSMSFPNFITTTEPGQIREIVEKNNHQITAIPSTWQLPPQDPTIWLDHYYSRHFDDYFNYKSLRGNKQGPANQLEIRGMGYYKHGLGRSQSHFQKQINSLNFCRLLPKLELPKRRESIKHGLNANEKTVYIHMGLPKTGTSAFQDAIHEYTKIDNSSPIQYPQIKNRSFKEYTQNGIELARAADHSTLDRFQNVIDEFCNAIICSKKPTALITSEDFSTMDSSFFGLIKKNFSNLGIRSIGIVVIRPFTDFAISFFKQYINMHVQMEFHNLLSYNQIAESARLHVEKAAINCLLCDDYSVIKYCKDGSVNFITELVYQFTDPMDLSEYNAVVNPSLSWETADNLYNIRQRESLHDDFESKEYLRLHLGDKDFRTKISDQHPYFAAVAAEREKLNQFFSMFPHKHRWEHLFAES